MCAVGAVMKGEGNGREAVHGSGSSGPATGDEADDAELASTGSVPGCVQAAAGVADVTVPGAGV